jgi:hypothetical protein
MQKQEREEKEVKRAYRWKPLASRRIDGKTMLERTGRE